MSAAGFPSLELVHPQRVGPFGAATLSGRSILGAEGGFARTPADSLFVSPSWIGVIEATYGFRVQAVTLGGDPDAAILFCEVDDIRGRRIISLPFSDYADPLAADLPTWQRLAEPLLATGAPVRLRCLRNAVPLRDHRFEHVNAVVWHAADLTRPEDEMWAGLAPTARQNIRRAERSGVTIRVGRSLDDVATFYAMHAKVRKTKYRLFAQPFGFFANLHSAFAGDDRIFVLLAEINGEPVAGILFLVHGDTLYYKFNASTEVGARPNDLLVWRGMLLGRELGLAALDFGVSDLDQPGLVRFKRKFATEERPVTELRWRGDGVDHRAREAGALLGRLTKTLTAPEVPDAVSRAVGDEVYRLFC